MEEREPILAIDISEKRSGSHLTPTLQAKFALDVVERLGSDVLIVDASGEGGVIASNGLKHDLANSGTLVVPCQFAGRTQVKGLSNKELGLQSLQRMLGWGLDTAADDYGWIGDWPELPEGASFGLVRFPFDGNWRKLHRELAVLRREDQHQRQDRAMTAVMLAWWLLKRLEGQQGVPQRFSIIPQRRRPMRSPTPTLVR
jgi:hypothetical protein